jgi:YD repeat-containing protein
MVIESGGFLLDSFSAIPSVPTAPSLLSANAISTSQINLTWTDNSFNETGFKIERKTGVSGTYSEIATTAAGATGFSNTGLQPNTQYFYRLRATNLGGDSAYSNESSAMTSNILPSVSVTAPTAGNVFTAPASITINASASDADGTVSKVEFFQDSTKLGEDLTAPYSFSWTNVAAGSYNLTARATDNLGGISTSAVVNITVNALPAISITAPAANAIFNSPANVTINASASDSDGTISKVEFFQNGTLLGEDSTPPYSCVWTNAPVGTFSLTARATDNRNATTTSAAIPVTVVSNAVSRLDPMNRIGGSGEDPLSRNFNWTIRLLNLPGRAGLDLDLSLSYNSLVWTKNGNIISFDDDHGFPSPGFRLGFPTIQPMYLNAETGQWSYLLIGSDGSRTELRRVTTTSVYFESADSSHLLLDTTDLTASDPKMILLADGTQLTFKPKGVAYECTEIKDRNGNYITINYNGSGQIANIHDTLDRTITFVYDNGRLASIEQGWKKPSDPSTTITHKWASFAYTSVPIQTNFFVRPRCEWPNKQVNAALESNIGRQLHYSLGKFSLRFRIYIVGTGLEDQ